MGRSAKIRSQRRRRARLSGRLAEWLAHRQRQQLESNHRKSEWSRTPVHTRVVTAAERADYRSRMYVLRQPRST